MRGLAKSITAIAAGRNWAGWTNSFAMPSGAMGDGMILGEVGGLNSDPLVHPVHCSDLCDGLQ